LNDVDSHDKSKIALKLHRQFAHPSAEKLKRLLIDAEQGDPALLKCVDNVTQNCETCIKYKKQRPRPVVALSMAKTFNETVAMDLKVWRVGTYFLVLVDLATRFCRAILIHDKKAETIIKCLFTDWISLFGAPKQFLSDNGGEFNNDEMRGVADSFAIKLVCTAAEAPWSNGVCERLNYILGLSVQKILDDTQCELSVALSWAISARNALQNCHGYSPNQLVFGTNPSFPSVYDGRLPSLENRTPYKIVADNLNAMHAARVDFLKNESSEKLRRALLHQVRTSDVDDLVNGDSVYFKRRDSD
jgi:transposase InsO family protein